MIVTDQILDELVEAIASNRPVILFLGQRYDSADLPFDPFVQRIDQHFGGDGSSATWDTLLQRSFDESAYQWITERFERQVMSEALEQIFDVAWSAVFTSSVDPRINTRLETRGRIPESVLSKDNFPRVPRSRARPGVHYLFGRSNETSNDTRPPRSRVELRRRSTVHANALINRIPETATALGLLVVAGVHEGDWLSVDDLLAPMLEQPGLRIVWFLSHQKPPQSELLEELIASGNLVFDERNLDELILNLDAEYVEEAIFQADTGTISIGKNSFLRLPASMRLRIEAAAAIVDDSWTDIPQPLDKPHLMESFRRFHGDLTGARGLVEGTLRGFSIERDFEHSAWQQLHSLAQRPGSDENLIILHGQSGMGKSLSIARLAGLVRSRLQLPVLFSWARVPLAHELDDFCEIAERCGAELTVILCDCNTEVRRYRELLDGLKSRGRRIIVVGTCYRLELDKRKVNKRYIEVPTSLSEKELLNLKTLIKDFGQSQSIDFDKAGYSLLPMLYRHLSVSRARIIGGINDEARATEELIRLRATSVPRPEKVPSMLAQKLLAALSETGKRVDIFESDAVLAAEGEDPAGRFIDYVMITGRLDCPVPVNLLLRAIRSVDESLDYAQIFYMFDQLDLFRWKMADGEGNDLLVFPRLQLEAELICGRRLAGTSREIKFIVELISAARFSSVDANAERDFLLDLLHKMHRDGPRLKNYQAGYLEFARALTTLREKHNIHDASLMLQESAFRREWIFISDGAASEQRIPDEERDEILEEAREVIELALAKIEDGKISAGKKTRHNLLVERATIYCYQAYGLARRKASAEEVMAHYGAAKVAIISASSSSSSYHPFDIAIWAPALIVKEDVLPSAQKHELLADIYSTFDSISADVKLRNYQAEFEERRMKIAQTLSDNKLGVSAFENLKKLKPAVAYYLHARSLCPEVMDTSASVDLAMKKRADTAVKFLENHYDELERDSRAIQLLIQLKWLVVAGERLMRHDRCVIPKDGNFQQKMLTYVETLNTLVNGNASNVYRLLEASLRWIVGDPAYAREQFNQLARDSDFEDGSRVVRRLLLVSDDADGFRGTVEHMRKEGNWSVSVKNFAGRIDLEARQFNNEDLRKGRELRGFNIAFNFLGPIADPIRTGGKP